MSVKALEKIVAELVDHDHDDQARTWGARFFPGAHHRKADGQRNDGHSQSGEKNRPATTGFQQIFLRCSKPGITIGVEMTGLVSCIAHRAKHWNLPGKGRIFAAGFVRADYLI
jgi:hypothetical protein